MPGLINFGGAGADPSAALLPVAPFGASEVGLYIVPGWPEVGTTTRTVTADRLYLHPIVVKAITSFDRIACNITTGATGVGRHGIYKLSAPDELTLVVDPGGFATGSTGVAEDTIDVTLTPGIYYLAIGATAAATFTRPNTSPLAPAAGAAVTSILGGPIVNGGAAGALPATIAASEVDGFQVGPLVALRVAA